MKVFFFLRLFYRRLFYRRLFYLPCPSHLPTTCIDRLLLASRIMLSMVEIVAVNSQRCRSMKEDSFLINLWSFSISFSWIYFISSSSTWQFSLAWYNNHGHQYNASLCFFLSFFFGQPSNWTGSGRELEERLRQAVCVGVGAAEG